MMVFMGLLVFSVQFSVLRKEEGLPEKTQGRQDCWSSQWRISTSPAATPRHWTVSGVQGLPALPKPADQSFLLVFGFRKKGMGRHETYRFHGGPVLLRPALGHVVRTDSRGK
jgi:hypothetical protein